MSRSAASAAGKARRATAHYDKHTVFADKLVAPRMILPLDDGVILTSETDSDDIIKLSDTNGDGVADKREVVFTGIGQSGDANIEHQKAGLVWNLDNWIYTDLQPVPDPLDAGRLPPRADRPERRPVGAGDRRRRQAVVRGRRRRARPDELPVSDSLRRVHAVRRPAAGSAAAAAAPPGPESQLPGRAWRTASRRTSPTVWPAPGIGDMQGGLGPHAHARAQPESLHRRHRAGHLPRRSAARGPAWRPALHRAGRPPDPARQDREHRGPDGAAATPIRRPSS